MIAPGVVNHIPVLLLKRKQLTLFVLKILEMRKKIEAQFSFVVNLSLGAFFHHIFIEYLLDQALLHQAQARGVNKTSVSVLIELSFL